MVVMTDNVAVADLWPIDAPFHDADYADAFTSATPSALSRSPEQWARHVLEDASLPMRTFLRVGWRFGLGFPLARGNAVLGWPVVAESVDWIVLQQQSWLFSVALLMRAADGELTWATRVKFWSPISVATWAIVGVIHRRFAPRALRRAVASAAS
jgi:hypothetical protein